MTDLATPGPETIPAEMALLGSLMLLHEPGKVLPLVKLLRPDDFYRAAHPLVFTAIYDLAVAERACDPVSVNYELMRRGDHGRLPEPTYLHTLMASALSVELAPQYAAQIAATARRRNAVYAVTKAADLLSRVDNDGDVVMHTLMAEIETYAGAGAPTREREPAETIDSFLAREVGYDWLVPGFIERGDRIIITGSEGAGKSTWTQQVAVCLAAGVHPFSRRPVDPLNVLIVDCENGTRHLRRKLAEIVQVVRRTGRNPNRLRVESRPSGLDLTRPDDAGWLLDVAAASRPDMLVIGPLYRLYTGAVKDEECARAVTVALDAVRARVGCSLLMEAHSPHGEGFGNRPLRPSGSSLWLRWPEFGYGLRLKPKSDVAELEPWRGPRDERTWPEVLRRGGDGRLPWVEASPEDWQVAG